jgi:hypothetical protein
MKWIWLVILLSVILIPFLLINSSTNSKTTVSQQKQVDVPLVLCHLGDEFPFYIYELMDHIQEMPVIPTVYFIYDSKEVEMYLRHLPVRMYYYPRKSTQNGLYFTSLERYRALHDFFQHYNFPFIHTEYDNLLYMNVEELYQHLQELCGDRVGFPMDCKDRGTASVMWCTKHMKELVGSITDDVIDDMHHLADFYHKFPHLCQILPVEPGHGPFFDTSYYGSKTYGHDLVHGIVPNFKPASWCENTVRFAWPPKSFDSFPLVNMHVHSKKLLEARLSDHIHKRVKRESFLERGRFKFGDYNSQDGCVVCMKEQGFPPWNENVLHWFVLCKEWTQEWENCPPWCSIVPIVNFASKKPKRIHRGASNLESKYRGYVEKGEGFESSFVRSERHRFQEPFWRTQQELWNQTPVFDIYVHTTDEVYLDSIKRHCIGVRYIYTPKHVSLPYTKYGHGQFDVLFKYPVVVRKPMMLYFNGQWKWIPDVIGNEVEDIRQEKSMLHKYVAFTVNNEDKKTQWLRSCRSTFYMFDFKLFSQLKKIKEYVGVP